MRAKMLRLLAVVCCALTTTAYANDPQNPRLFTGYAAVMSNYIGRGLSQSVGNPAVQVELDLHSSGGWYATLDGTSINWIDQLYPGDSVSVEFDGIVGYRWHFADDWKAKGGVLRLQFPGRYVPQLPPAARPDTTEIFGSLGWRGLSGQLNYAVTNAFGTPDSRGSWYLSLSAVTPVGDAWRLGGHVGRKQSRGIDPNNGLANSRFSYTDYKLTIAKAFSANISVTVDYVWTNANRSLYTLNGYNVAGHHFAVTLEKDF